MGDSGFRLLRPLGRALVVETRSREQQRSFNMPYQLGTRSRDRPSDGDKYEADLLAGDLIVRRPTAPLIGAKSLLECGATLHARVAG